MVDDTVFSTHTNIRMNGYVGTVEYGGGDRGMVVFFYNKPMQNMAKTVENGRPYFEDKVFVKIQQPGERLNIVDRPVQDTDKQRWPVQWAQFVQNKEQIPEGTMIDLLYPEQPAVAATLRAGGVHTVEQLAELSAGAIETIGMGCQQWVNYAQKYLSDSNRGVKATQMRHELEERDRRIKLLERELGELKDITQKLMQERQGNVGLRQLQETIAGIMERPVHMPAVPFDPQAAMINATHPTVTEQPQKKGRRRPRLG